MCIVLYALPDAGDWSKLGTLKAPWHTMFHDFMATERHLLFILGPAKLHMLRATAGVADLTRSSRGGELGRGSS